MPAKLNITNRAAGYNAGQNYYARMMRADDIITDPEISGIFRIDDRVLDEIAQSIKEKGYDRSQPLVVWKGRNILVDGHTRYAAVSRLGIEEVPVVEKEFDDLEEAMLYTFERQAIRRNLTSAEILAAAQLLKGRKERDGTGRAAEKIAKKLGIGITAIYQAKKVNQEAPLEDLEKIQKGRMSIKAAYEKIKESKKPAKESETKAAVEKKEHETAVEEKTALTPVKQELGLVIKLLMKLRSAVAGTNIQPAVDSDLSKVLVKLSLLYKQIP